MLILMSLLLIAMVHHGRFSPVVSYDKRVRYEEYTIEHEISATQAKNAALTIDLSSVRLTHGCQSCSNEELRYCAGTDLINDHCCCDKRFSESLPFIPHTCYSGTVLCKPIVEDCEEYYRRKACCCDKFSLQFWKKKWMEKSTQNSSSNQFNINLLLLYIYFLIYFL
ncbi:hypothetical protein WA026_002449 [Henosepilachna vigintioctopunctata]|uniref:CCC domain-containing protein n=1 Tax=Henosepilachna vigintioctopunctata TaxID=420089 RepID=A0AAW1TZQ9_9CUCU